MNRSMEAEKINNGGHFIAKGANCVQNIWIESLILKQRIMVNLQECYNSKLYVLMTGEYKSHEEVIQELTNAHDDTERKSKLVA